MRANIKLITTTENTFPDADAGCLNFNTLDEMFTYLPGSRLDFIDAKQCKINGRHSIKLKPKEKRIIVGTNAAFSNNGNSPLFYEPLFTVTGTGDTHETYYLIASNLEKMQTRKNLFYSTIFENTVGDINHAPVKTTAVKTNNQLSPEMQNALKAYQFEQLIGDINLTPVGTTAVQTNNKLSSEMQNSLIKYQFECLDVNKENIINNNAKKTLFIDTCVNTDVDNEKRIAMLAEMIPAEGERGHAQAAYTSSVIGKIAHKLNKNHPLLKMFYKQLTIDQRLTMSKKRQTKITSVIRGETPTCYRLSPNLFSRNRDDENPEQLIDNELINDGNISDNIPEIPVIIRDMHAHPWVMLKHLYHKGIIPSNEIGILRKIGITLLELEEICEAIKSEVSRSKSCAQIKKYTQLKEEFTTLVTALNILTTHDIIAVGDTHADRGPNDELVTILFDHVIDEYKHTTDKSFTILQSNHEKFRSDFFDDIFGCIITKKKDGTPTEPTGFTGSFDKTQEENFKIKLRSYFVDHSNDKKLIKTFMEFEQKTHRAVDSGSATSLNTSEDANHQADSLTMNMYTLYMSCLNDDDSLNDALLDKNIDDYYQSYKKHHEHAKVCVFNPDNNTLYTHAPCTILDVLIEAFNAADALSDPTNTPPGFDDTRNPLCKSTATGNTLREFDWDTPEKIINDLTNPTACPEDREIAIKAINTCVEFLNKAKPMATFHHNRDDNEMPIIWARQYEIAAEILDSIITDQRTIKIPESDYEEFMIAGLTNETAPDQTLMHVTGHDGSSEEFMNYLDQCLSPDTIVRRNRITQKLVELFEEEEDINEYTYIYSHIHTNRNKTFGEIIKLSDDNQEKAIAYVKKFFAKVLVYDANKTKGKIRRYATQRDTFEAHYAAQQEQNRVTAGSRVQHDDCDSGKPATTQVSPRMS